MIPHHVHVHSMRLESGDEVLLARVVARTGRIGYGFSLTLDATAARHMAERNAGVRPGEPGDAAAVPPQIEAAFPSIQWFPA